MRAPSRRRATNLPSFTARRPNVDSAMPFLRQNSAMLSSSAPPRCASVSMAASLTGRYGPARWEDNHNPFVIESGKLPTKVNQRLKKGKMAPLQSSTYERQALARPRPRPHQLRRRGLLALPAPLLREEHGLLGRDARAARGGHRRFEERLQQLPPALSRDARGSEARRARSRRTANRIPDRVTRRSVPVAHLDDVQEPHVDRRRGAGARAAD